MYGVGDEINIQTLHSVEKDIQKLNSKVYKLKTQFKHMFPESIYHEISQEEKVKFQAV